MADVTGPEPASLPSVAEALRHLSEVALRGCEALESLRQAMLDLPSLPPDELG